MEKQITKEAMHYKVCQSLASGGEVGSAIYPLIWIIILVIEKPYNQYPGLCIFLSFFYIIMPLIRYFGLIYRFEKVYHNWPQIWFYSFFLLTILLSLSCGILSAIVFITPNLEHFHLITMFILVGLVGGCTSTLQSSLPIIVAMLCSFLLPTIGILIICENNLSMMIIAGFFVYFAGSFLVSRTQHNNYLQLLEYSFAVESHSRKIAHLNTIDSLTGLKNRGYFDQTLGFLLRKKVETSSQVSLLLLDIDHFKMINDTYGHVTGDKCLRELGALLRKHIKRQPDVAARYGGEEFAIILPSTSGDDAKEFAEKLKAEIQELCIVTDTDHTISFTVSIGVCSIDSNREISMEQFVSCTDSALYQAKNAGRNMVVFDDAKRIS